MVSQRGKGEHVVQGLWLLWLSRLMGFVIKTRLSLCPRMCERHHIFTAVLRTAEAISGWSNPTHYKEEARNSSLIPLFPSHSLIFSHRPFPLPRLDQSLRYKLRKITIIITVPSEFIKTVSQASQVSAIHEKF